jgi:hypothetical protein
MPRKARLDAPGALHYVIARGIEKRDIFWDDCHRSNFLNRISQSSISMSVHRGKQMAERQSYALVNELKLQNRRASP